MKQSLLFLSFLLLNSFLSFAAEKPNPVLDHDGDEIRAGVEYYIVSSIRGAGGGGVTYGRSISNESCPLPVVQEKLDLLRGHPVTFTPVNSKEGVVRVSTDLNIKFSEATPVCNESNVWKLDFDEELGQHFILTNGVEGNPGCGTIHNWFKIEEAFDKTYRLVFCPTVCNICNVICKDVGVFSDRRLALGGTRPFTVFILKARSMKNADILKSISSAFRFK
ncbi:21 kDa seed protein-like [Coffea eugenioides]|uniref:21 kDa seed protein-like n=1 Tax=Coffea eugenioides TaxID=49369 RepID=UPI000F60E390|nr:21 kDa seed protein-like [Coffea eugenioides]